MAYCAYITKIKDLRKHSNADRLQVGTCFGNNVIVSLETKEGQLGVYFPVDGKLGIDTMMALLFVTRLNQEILPQSLPNLILRKTIRLGFTMGKEPTLGLIN